MVRNLFGKSFFIESKEPGRTNRHAHAVSLAQICINCDLAHYRYSPLLPPGRTTERLWAQCTPGGVMGSMSLRVLDPAFSYMRGTYREAQHCVADWDFRQ